MTTIAEPHFVDRDPEQVERDVLQAWEDLTGQPLEPAAPERLFLKTLAYRETLVRVALQEAAKQCLLRYSRFPVTDALAELIGQPRLEAQAASCTIRWSLSAAHGADIVVPSGTRRQSRDGRVMFATVADALIATGETFVDVKATATTLGTPGNGYTAGQIDVEVDPVDPLITSAENTTESAGGAPRETDAQFIERLLLGPDVSSTAGAKEAYEFWARSVSAEVLDVSALSPDPGLVRLAVHVAGGSASPELLEAIVDVVSAETKRPICDTVETVAATPVPWTCTANLRLYRNADIDSTVAAAVAAVEAYAETRRERLGRSIVPSQVSARLDVPGVYSVELTSPVDIVDVGEGEFAELSGEVVLTVVEIVEEDGDGVEEDG